MYCSLGGMSYPHMSHCGVFLGAHWGGARVLNSRQKILELRAQGSPGAFISTMFHVLLHLFFEIRTPCRHQIYTRLICCRNLIKKFFGAPRVQGSLWNGHFGYMYLKFSFLFSCCKLRGNSESLIDASYYDRKFRYNSNIPVEFISMFM